jgi:hypothetical protein
VTFFQGMVAFCVPFLAHLFHDSEFVPIQFFVVFAAVDGYLHFARQVFGDESAFYSEAALDILHDAGYDVPRAQRRLVAPLFDDFASTDLNLESAIETRRLQLLELVVQRRQADADDARAFSERVRARLNSTVPLSFVELQQSIMESALRAWDSLPIAVELRLLQGRASRWSNRLRPILTAISAPAARVSVVSAALAQASSATAQPKDTAVSAPTSTGTGSCSLEVLYSLRYLFVYCLLDLMFCACTGRVAILIYLAAAIAIAGSFRLCAGRGARAVAAGHYHIQCACLGRSSYPTTRCQGFVDSLSCACTACRGRTTVPAHFDR